jgi:ubiquinone/menaquinone biosynthesis C-methylase UbiE
MKNWLYEFFVRHMTTECYGSSLHYVARGSHLLDVGIGNGIMIETFHPLIKAKDLRITGIDIDADYLARCGVLIARHQLEDYVNVCRGCAETYVAPQERCFDVVLFGMSFMVLRDQRTVLRRARNWLKPGGEIVFVQTMFRKRSRLLDLVKPKLKYFTTIDFGTAVYEKDFFALLQENGLSIKEDRVLTGAWFNNQSRMIVTTFQDHPSNQEAAGIDSQPRVRAYSRRRSRQEQAHSRPA